jgi:hypothetical protein
MRTHREVIYFRFGRVIAAVLALGFGGLARAQDGAGESAPWILVSCTNPTVVSQFVASDYPEDIALLLNAVAKGVCRYSEERLPVEPVQFVGEVRANAQAAEPIGYIWAVRLPDRVVAYSYFWRSGHEAMLASTPPRAGKRLFVPIDHTGTTGL